MANERKVNRYSLVMEFDVEDRPIENDEQLNELIEKIHNYNLNKKRVFLIGGLVKQTYYLQFTKYQKVSVPATLQELDNLTIRYDSETNFKASTFDIYHMNPLYCNKVYIAYKASGEVRLLPLIYKKDAKYLNVDYLERVFTKLGASAEFLSLLLNSDLIKASSINAEEELDKLYALREAVKSNNKDKINLAYMNDFFNKFVYEEVLNKVNGVNVHTGKFKENYQKKRLLANLVIEYNEKVNDRYIPDEKQLPKELVESYYESLNKNKKKKEVIDGQISIEEMTKTLKMD